MKLSAEFLADAEERLSNTAHAPSPPQRRRARRAQVDAAVPVDLPGIAVAPPMAAGEVEERSIGPDDMVDMSFLERALAAGRPVCRIVVELHGASEFATGFMVSPRVMMTNQHVLPTADRAERARAEFDLRIDGAMQMHSGVPFAFRPDLFYASDKALDVAFVAVAAESIRGGRRLTEFGHHRLFAAPRKIEPGDAITIIQHPRGEPRKIALRENRLLAFLDDDRLLYGSDTASGSSGAPAFSDDFQVVALHRAGRAARKDGGYLLLDGTVVASLRGIDESRVDWEANEGVRISAICRYVTERLGHDSDHDNGNELLEELKSAMAHGGDVISQLQQGLTAEPLRGLATGVAQRQPSALGAATALTPGAVLDLPLRVQVSLATTPSVASGQVAVASPDVVTGAFAEKYVSPRIDTDYTNRRGFDTKFLGRTVGLPRLTPAGKALAATMDGRTRVDYEHFSVVLHRERRMAIYTASNVDWIKEHRFGELTRKDLTGLKDGEIEKWVSDPRLPAAWQLPDTFYTKDRKSFDKGHLVRRDDVCWGATTEEVIRANGDSFHVTNCSPQRSDFNRSAEDDRAWGDLENLIQHGVTRCCVFSGPVFDDVDPEFEGRDEVGPTRVQIPSRYWKVVVEQADDGSLRSYAFILRQDLTDVQMEELDVPAVWKTRRIKIAALEAELALLKFTAAVRAADVLG
ncbi:MAG: DNA/RNA non-specific endonuclease [Ilumatobacteraceae bacterium]|nr:DNA/RNA non-specific endonuclease [Ilumatobacteraceae bacterium]